MTFDRFMKKLLLIFLVLIVIAFLIRGNVNSLISGKVVKEVNEDNIIPQDFGDINIYFCPQDGCEDVLLSEIRKSENVDCAFFDLDLANLIDLIQKKDYRLILDNSNLDNVRINFVRSDKRRSYMHNKFCILDNSKVITGSMNPTKNDANRNNNNLIIIESKTLAGNYLDEFNEMWGGIYGKGSKVINPKILFNGFLVENYFCPEDKCEEHVLNLLKEGRRMIYFMTYSFTSDEIGEELLKNYYYGIDVKGVFDKRQVGSKYSEYHRFKDIGMDVRLDNSTAIMHHKVFIVDDVVIFGSYNPTKSGNENNDENILVMHDKETAEKFVNEFNRIFNEEGV